MSWKNAVSKLMVLAIAGGTLLVGSARPAQARDRDDACGNQVRQAEANYRKAVQKHGEHSKQANKRRQQLDAARDRCHNRGWGNENRGHDRDHDRDHR